MIGTVLGSGFNFGAEGDDIFYLSKYFRTHFINPDMNYVEIVMGRWGLIKTYTGLYEAFDYSQQAMHFLFVLIWACSGFLCFIWLRKVFNDSSAMVGAAFFLAYSGKYETIGWASAGLHIFVLCLLLLILIVFQTERLNFGSKLIASSLLYWISLHYYEILLPLCPLPLLYLLVKRTATGKRKFLFSSLPILISLFHVYLLSLRPKPIWIRNEGHGSTALIESMPSTLAKTFAQLLGSDHRHLIRESFRSLRWTITQNSDLALTIGSLTILAAAIGLYIFSQPPHERPEKKPIHFYLIFGSWLVFVCPLVTTPVVMGMPFAPSRLTYLPSLGITVLLTAAIYTYSKVWIRAAVTVVVLLEALTLQSLFYQYSTAAAFDDDIRSRLKSFDVKFQPHQLVAITLNHDQRFERLWKTVSSKFDNGGAQSLLLIDNDYLLPNDAETPLHLWLRYEGIRQGKSSSRNADLAFERLDNGKICYLGTSDCR